MERDDDAYFAGRAAWEDGLDESANPYPERSDKFLDWNDGYNDAADEEE